MKYKWNFDRLTALLVALSNVIVTCIIVGFSLTDNSFMRHQIGLSKEPSMTIKMIIAGLVVLLVILLVKGFIEKKEKYRKILALYQTVLLAFILRNIIVVFVFTGLQASFQGFVLNHELLNMILGVVLAITIYNTLFSKYINDYFNIRS